MTHIWKIEQVSFWWGDSEDDVLEVSAAKKDTVARVVVSPDCICGPCKEGRNNV